eukprot:TRINITY_DN14751_c0_g1_i4.p1 TRINITY_DN14751_c0_g1~~TRINITY_DN14751_c0_g1_i4.p1  ORF type:complete len:641 (-),score=133.96 TRINITY_DN14751_c0_g1_i4:296-2218(-)
MFGSSTSPTDIPAKVRVGERKLKGKAYVAEGGFSHVFAVKDTKTKEYFALKRMSCQNQDELAHAIEEVAIMKKLPPHENVVALEGVEITHSQKGFSTVDVLMQLYKGGRLIDVMKTRTKHFSVPELLDIFMCIAKAAEHLHLQEPPIAHRDLKIENVLLDQATGVYKVCDFGSCSSQVHVCETEQDVALLRADIELNTTPTYRAPEMLDLRVGTIVGTEADIWALGCTLYKMAYFKDAFTDGAPKIISGQYTIPSDPAYPQALHHLLGLCLNVQRQARPTADILTEHVDMIRASSWADLNQTNVPLMPPSSSTAPMADPGPPMTNPPAPAAPPEELTTTKSELPANSPNPTHGSPRHRRMPGSAAATLKTVSKSSDAGGVYTQTADTRKNPEIRQCKSDDAVLGAAKRENQLKEVQSIEQELHNLAEQEAKIKQRRRALEARLVQLYDLNPSMSGIASRGLVAPVSAQIPQVEVASFFAGEHDRSKTPGQSSHTRSTSELNPRELLLPADHGPRSRVGSEASETTWPDVILTLDDVDMPPGSEGSTGSSQTLTNQPAKQENPFREPASSAQRPNPSGRPQGAGHRRSASLTASKLSIRPNQQRSDRKSSPTIPENVPKLQPPPPAKPRLQLPPAVTQTPV